ncbi:hypothetical protein OIU78_024353 [Salix suchowensis]|nr:hypothetical protein OIU78_024353 [Salix suchowensis]
MVGIPNDLLASLAGSMKAAEKWVSKNVSAHVTNNNVNIRYVAVGNEPFLQTYNGSFLRTTFPALQNVQSALIKAGLGNLIKVTVPLNADVYESSSGLPSGGDFRADIHDLMLTIVKFLNDAGAPFTVNIYPFISLYIDSNFPVEYAFFDGNANPVNDGGTSYYNMFDANYDTLVYALQKNGFGNLPIIVGEIGWPTDGDRNANVEYARRFNQGFMSHIASGKGTPMRPNAGINAYLFSLIDEDAKSIDPGNFERHWGIFTFDGIPKYSLNLGTTNTGALIPARSVRYLDRKWCVMKPSAKVDDPQVALSVSYACGLADCTSLGYGTSCGNLDARENISYAFQQLLPDTKSTGRCMQVSKPVDNNQDRSIHSNLQICDNDRAILWRCGADIWVWQEDGIGWFDCSVFPNDCVKLERSSSNLHLRLQFSTTILVDSFWSVG